MRHAPPVTVIVPCYNEREGLPSLLTRLAALQQDGGCGWQVLFVDDGSADETFAHLLGSVRRAPWAKVLRHPTNLGLGAALRTGFRYSSSPVVCTIDSDCTYPPERLPELVALVNKGADIATASAWHPSSRAAEGNPVRIALSRAVSGLYKLLIGQDVHTFTCLFRAYRREWVRTDLFESEGFLGVAEALVNASFRGARITEFPIRLGLRKYGQSKMRVLSVTLQHLRLMTATFFTQTIRTRTADSAWASVPQRLPAVRR